MEKGEYNVKKLIWTGFALLGIAVIVLGLWYFIPTVTKESLGDLVPFQITGKSTAIPMPTNQSAPVYSAVDALKNAESNQTDALQNLQNKQGAATQAAENLKNAQVTATAAANGVTNAKATVAAAGNTLVGAPTSIATQTPLPTIGPKP